MDALNAPPFKSGLHSMRIDNCGPTYALQPLIWNRYELFSKLETRIKFDNVGRSFRCSTIEIHSELICSSFCNAGRVVTYDGSHAHVARAWNTVPNHDESRRLHPVPCTRDVRVSARPHNRRWRRPPRLILRAATSGRIDPAPCTSALESSASVASACLNDT